MTHWSIHEKNWYGNPSFRVFKDEEWAGSFPDIEDAKAYVRFSGFNGDVPVHMNEEVARRQREKAEQDAYWNEEVPCPNCETLVKRDKLGHLISRMEKKVCKACWETDSYEALARQRLEAFQSARKQAGTG